MNQPVDEARPGRLIERVERTLRIQLHGSRMKELPEKRPSFVFGYLIVVLQSEVRLGRDHISYEYRVARIYRSRQSSPRDRKLAGR
jgi:hypothetical protein